MRSSLAGANRCGLTRRKGTDPFMGAQHIRQIEDFCILVRVVCLCAAAFPRSTGAEYCSYSINVHDMLERILCLTGFVRTTSAGRAHRSTFASLHPTLIETSQHASNSSSMRKVSEAVACCQHYGLHESFSLVPTCSLTTPHSPPFPGQLQLPQCPDLLPALHYLRHHLWPHSDHWRSWFHWWFYFFTGANASCV